MTKELFEEALADVKRVKQLAEDNAKRAVLEAVTPRIREFIDRALLEEHDDVELESVPGAPGAPDLDGEMITDLVAVDPDSEVPAGAITPPDAEGKVTLDIDAMRAAEPGAPVAPPMFGGQTVEDEYEISLESVNVLKPVLSAGAVVSNRTLEARIAKMVEHVGLCKGTGRVVRSTKAFGENVAQMISDVENMYDYVQEHVADPARKSKHEAMLEASFKDLNKLQETLSMKNAKSRINEADVTLKLTGLPDDVDLDSVGVDLITDEDEADLEPTGEEGMESGEEGEDLDNLDLGAEGGEEVDASEQEQQMEARRLSDDTIVEIDENMLRREVARMRKLREHTETKPQSWGNGASHAEDFGGASEEGEPLDVDTLDESEEQDEDLDESDDQDLEQMGDRSKDSTFGPAVANGHESETWDKRKTEATQRVKFEKRLQERAQLRASALKKEAAKAKASKNAKRLAEVKREYAVVAKRFNESLERTKRALQLEAKATKKLQEASSNSVARKTVTEDKNTASLRVKLAETNLLNAKLVYVNKLLQNEQLTSRQKAQVIKQLDEAQSVREAKLVYESLSRALVTESSNGSATTEGRQVLGSGSRVTRPAATQALNEGCEAERWAKLAGITK